MKQTTAEIWKGAYNNPLRLAIALARTKACDFDYLGGNEYAFIALFDDHSRLEISPEGIKVLTNECT